MAEDRYTPEGTEFVPAYLPGRSVPRYVERLDEVEWDTDCRAERSPLPTILAALAVVIGAVAIVIGLVL